MPGMPKQNSKKSDLYRENTTFFFFFFKLMQWHHEALICFESWHSKQTQVFTGVDQKRHFCLSLIKVQGNESLTAVCFNAETLYKGLFRRMWPINLILDVTVMFLSS